MFSDVLFSFLSLPSHISSSPPDKLLPTKNLPYKKSSISSSPFLPSECLQEIFSYLSDDAITLSKCLLVSKFWFENAASILWKSPFDRLQKPSAKLIDIYLKFLDVRSKTILAKVGIISSHSDSYISEFTYAHYVKTLHYKGLYESARAFVFGGYCRPKDLEGELKCLTLVREISLFLIRKCPLINVISYDTEEIDFYIQDIYLLSLNLIPEVYHLFKRVKKLTCGGKYNKGSLMNVLSTYCKNLLVLELNFHDFDMYDFGGDRKEPNMMSTLILEQKSLRNLIIRGSFRFLADVLIPLESQSKTLSIIQFERVQFNDSLPLKSVSTCKNLETLIFIDCVNLKDETLLPLASVSFIRLKKLIFKNSYRTRLDNLAKLIQNTKGSLREIRFRRREFKNMVIRNVPDIPVNVIKIISRYCPNLVIYEGHIERETMPHFLTMLETTFLEKLFISVEYKNGEFFRSQVAFHLPYTLYHLSISYMDHFSCEDLKLFLELCSAPLESLQFPQSTFIDDGYLDIISDFARQIGSLKKITFSKNSSITEKGIQKARRAISFVKKNGEEYV